jgi:hypothetical protein
MRKLLRREKDYYANNAYANFLRLMCAKRYMGLKHMRAQSMYVGAEVSGTIIMTMFELFARVCMSLRAYCVTYLRAKNMFT